jgi:hypothetical protein
MYTQLNKYNKKLYINCAESKHFGAACIKRPYDRIDYDDAGGSAVGGGRLAAAVQGLDGQWSMVNGRFFPFPRAFQLCFIYPVYRTF